MKCKLFSRNKDKASRNLVCGDIWTSSLSMFIPSRCPMFYPDITIFCGAWLVATKHFSLKVLFFFFLLLPNFSATLVLLCGSRALSVISAEVMLAGRRGVFLSRINKPYLNMSLLEEHWVHVLLRWSNFSNLGRRASNFWCVPELFSCDVQETKTTHEEEDVLRYKVILFQIVAAPMRFFKPLK